jgi:hypothetical protein
MTEVLRRFLDAYGPATNDDFARWWGCEPKYTRPLFAEHAGELGEVVVEGKKLWATGEHADAVADAVPASGTHLLPGFDPYVTGSGTIRAHLVPKGFETRVSRKGAWISPIVVVDGRVVGVWSHDVRKGRVLVTIDPFAPLKPKPRRAVEAAAEVYGRLLDGPVEVAWA